MAEPRYSVRFSRRGRKTETGAHLLTVVSDVPAAVIVVPLDGGMALRELYDTDEERDQLTGELIARGFHRVLLKDETESETEPG